MSFLIRRDLQPYIHSWRLSIIRLVQNVRRAIPIEIGDPGYVEIHAGAKDCFTEISFSITEQNPRGCIRIVRVFACLGPLVHLRRKDVQVSVSVNVRHGFRFEERTENRLISL